MAKIKWLDRTLTVCAYYYCLCLSEEEFKRAWKECGIPHSAPDWVSPNANATAHTLTHNGKALAFVCLGSTEGKTGIQVAALLCHEAVHIWQRHASYIGSFNDHGDEEEAYAIQNIAQALMESYVEKTHG